MNKKNKLGEIGENFVSNLLKKNSFKILERNYRTRFGEIDIIAQKGDLVVFVEVKTRSKIYFPISSVVNFSKQQKIIKTTKNYVLEKKIVDKILRFDVATVTFENENEKIEYIENAFQEI